MGKTRRCERVLEECERQLRINREPLKDLRREMRNAKKFVGRVDWEDLEDA